MITLTARVDNSYREGVFVKNLEEYCLLRGSKVEFWLKEPGCSLASNRKSCNIDFENSVNCSLHLIFEGKKNRQLLAGFS